MAADSSPVWEHVFVSSQGSAYQRFRRALLTGNSVIVDAAARELPAVGLEDALRILVFMAHADDPRYERAATKWAARVTAERRLGLDDARKVLALVEVLPSAADAVEPVLRRLCT